MVSNSTTDCDSGWKPDEMPGLSVALCEKFKLVVLKPFSHVQCKGSVMKTSTLKALRACSLTIALLGSAAFVTALSAPDMAYAKSGNESGGNGNGNGGSNGNGNGGNGKSNGNGNGNNSTATDSGEKTKANSNGAEATKKTKARTKAKSEGLANALGVSASELGALNAAHANANAFKNASPNSRVGRIGAYRDAVLEGRELEADLMEKASRLEGMEAPRDLADIESDLAGAQGDVAARADELARLEAMVDPDELELEAARTALAETEAAEQALQDELANAGAYADLEAEIADLEERLEDQPELERDLLEAAANKPVTDAVEAAVKKLLGL